MSEWIIIGGIFMLAVLVFIAMHLSERDNLTLARALIILNCGNVSDTYYLPKSDECVLVLCEHLPIDNKSACRYAGRNITESVLYSQAEKGDLA